MATETQTQTYRRSQCDEQNHTSNEEKRSLLFSLEIKFVHELTINIEIHFIMTWQQRA